MSLPTVCIIGRPNTGKSTLFNAMIGQRKAIVSDIAGTTRDRVVSKVEGNDRDYWLVDTAGLTSAAGEELEQEMQLQTDIALEEADVVLCVFDAKRNLTADDHNVVAKLRRAKQPVVVVANKLDDGNPAAALELSGVGLGMPVVVSAKNNFGLWELYEAIEAVLPPMPAGMEAEQEETESENEDVYAWDEEEVSAEEHPEHEAEETEEAEVRALKLAVVGRPNVGKSTLCNAFLQENRSTVSDIPGTTRDTIDSVYVSPEGVEYTLLDTAGLRRKGKLGRKIEYWSAVRTAQAIERSDVCALLLDSLEGVTHQDMTIINQVIEAGKGLVIVVNKFDLVHDKARENETDEREIDEIKMWGEDLDKIRKDYWYYLSQRLPFASWAPVLFVSAKTGKAIGKILEAAVHIERERRRRISTAALNRWLPEIVYGHVMPSKGSRIGKIKYISQVDTCPPKIGVWVNNAEAFHFSYRRYLENRLREKFGWYGTPVVISFRDAMGDRRKKRRK